MLKTLMFSKKRIAHINKHNILDPLQRYFHKSHSTETVLLRITDTILASLNNNTCCQLILLRISSTSDTIGHKILISRLSLMGIFGIAL